MPLYVFMKRKADYTAPGILDVPFAFQVPPTGGLTLDGSFSHSDYDTLRLGQRSRAIGPQLRDISFATLFLDYSVGWDNAIPGAEFDALGRADELFEIMDAGTPFTLLVGNPKLRDSWDYEGLATLRTVRCEERDGEPDARYVDATFKEYEALKVQVNRRSAKIEQRRSHTLTSKDTLGKLAKKFYGDPSLWYKIASDNGIRGVTANSAKQLAAWAKKHSKKKLKVEPRGL